ncbi:hypothetical protein CkaCkLH20_04764 [Colletotrichum karsti]|uniref:Uncharacterized protein n=1 Tax=Colletotrichum karsti TaxID=1095194 RepID=A0A9P6I7Y9_9PEZI|nr:uncharacterized protein CkaCkLH20_04764 [Colletotrichum karsti]KAF9877629.1 hypothetical protein CkaCkLH20_04764 [Colletotrichum karsti]
MEGDECSPLEGKSWSRVASNVPDPPKCIEECRARFLRDVVQGYDDSRLPEVCGILSKNDGAQERLWDLYCCNSSACGVKPEMGQDPGVNWIVNRCQSHGIQDPGPPSLGHICPVIGPPGDCAKGLFYSDGRPHPTPYATQSQGFWATPTSASMTSSVSATRSGHSASGTSSASNLKQSDEDQPSGSLPLGPRIAIGVCGAVVLLAIVAVAICLYRRRSRRGYTQSIKSEIKHNPLPQACSPTPLISPTASTHENIHNPVPLTPPPRLKERRILPTLLTPTSSEFGGSFPGTPVSNLNSSTSSFPQPPFVTQRNSSFSSRHHRPTKSLVNPPSTIFQGKELKTASMSSATTGRTARTVSNTSSGFPYPVPSSPSRPARPHEMPLRIPDLVCPGPPPNRALPPPPPPVSPVSPIALLRQHSTDNGHNVSMALAAGFIPPRNPARGVVLGKDSRDFCDLTESYARESKDRDSWGSWSIGAGGTILGSSSIQRGGERVNSPVLEEADLERMGGRY